MENSEKKASRPLDKEELTPEQEEKVVGGIQMAGFNTVNFNTANFNTANFNAANFNTANFNTSRLDVPFTR